MCEAVVAAAASKGGGPTHALRSCETADLGDTCERRTGEDEDVSGVRRSLLLVGMQGRATLSLHPPSAMPAYHRCWCSLGIPRLASKSAWQKLRCMDACIGWVEIQQNVEKAPQQAACAMGVCLITIAADGGGDGGVAAGARGYSIWGCTQHP
jgi:hypothetical protein